MCRHALELAEVGIVASDNPFAGRTGLVSGEESRKQ